MVSEKRQSGIKNEGGLQKGLRVSEESRGYHGEGQRGFSRRIEGSIQRKKDIGFQRGQTKTEGFRGGEGFFLPVVSSLAYLKMAGSQMCT